MNHSVFGSKLSRETGQRMALLKGLVGAMVRSLAIETTETKAKAVKGLMEELVTKAKRGTLHDIRQLEAMLGDKDIVFKLVHEIAPSLAGRPGGYIRMIKMGNRVGDNAPMIRMEFVAKPVAAVKAVATPKVVKESKPDKKVVAKKAVVKTSKKVVAKPKTKKA